ncbi:MAG: BrnT family toxin [Trichlorobacter sp.]|nr:BrnT family toxin [Trichlorobacter sp.]
MVRFEWHQQKAASNIKKHGVSFDEASTVFNDPLARIFDDPAHSLIEARELIIGCSVAGRMLVISFLEREAGLVRIISARPATRKEQADYEENI